MSLWTPEGEVPIEPERRPGVPSPEDLSPEERERAEQMVAEMAELQRQIAAAPASQLVANHIIGLYELAAIHLAQETPKLDEAKLAIDAMAAVVDAVADRLPQEGPALRQALTQVQMAFVERQEEGGTS